MEDGFGPGRPIPRELGPVFGPIGPGTLAMDDGLVPMFPEACEKEAEFAPKRPAALRIGARSRPWGPVILKLRPDPVPNRPPALVSRFGPGPRPPALGLGPRPGPIPLARGLDPRPGPGNIPDLGAGFVPKKPDLRLGFGPGPRPPGLGLGGPFPEDNKTPDLKLGPDPGPMGVPLLRSGLAPRRPPALGLDIGPGPGPGPGPGRPNLGLDIGPGPGRAPALGFRAGPGPGPNRPPGLGKEAVPVPVGFIPLGKEAMLGSREPAGKGAGFEANEPDEDGKDGFLGNGARFPPREPAAIRKGSEFTPNGWPVFRTGPPCGPREPSSRPRGGNGARVQGVGRSLGKIRGSFILSWGRW